MPSSCDPVGVSPRGRSGRVLLVFEAPSAEDLNFQEGFEELSSSSARRRCPLNDSTYGSARVCRARPDRHREAPAPQIVRSFAPTQ
jgi:hypothetical protein